MTTPLRTTDDAPYAEWREQLAPWLRALHKAELHVELSPLPTVSDIEELWIHVKTPEGDANTREGWTPFIEALEMMELLARVEPCAAWYLLLELTGQQHIVTQYKTLLFESSGVLPKFVVQVEEDEPLEEYTFQGLLRLVIDNTAIWTVPYSGMKAKLEAQWREKHNGEELERRERVRLSIEFEVFVQFDNDPTVGAALEPIRDLAYAHIMPSAVQAQSLGGRETVSATGSTTIEIVASDEEEEASLVERGVFSIVSFRYKLGHREPFVTDLVLDLVDQASRYIHISHFTVAQLYREQLHQSTFGNFLLNHLSPWQGRRDNLGIQTLRLDITSLDAAAVLALCTGIVSSRGLQEFVFVQDWVQVGRLGPAESDLWWPWLVYALFSREASHNIRSVSLCMYMLDDQRTFVRPGKLLQYQDPLAFLLRLPDSAPVVADVGTINEEAESSISPQAAELSETALIRIGRYADAIPDEPEPPAAVTVHEPGVTFRVTRNQPEDDFIEFLFPGMGICWTERQHLRALTPVKQRDTHTIRHLTLTDLEGHTVIHATDLLEAVGGPLQWLTIVDLEGASSIALLDAVATFCPNLKRLDLKRCYLDTLSWFTEPRDGLFKLETLCIDDPTVDDLSSWSTFFSALKDGTHPLAQSLRELHVGFRDMEPNLGLQDEVFGHVVSVLQTNQYLARVELWTDREAMLSKYSASVLAHQDEYLPEEDCPVLPAAKLAFLGVFMSTNKTTSHRGSPVAKNAKVAGFREDAARFMVNPESVQLIFDYAAKAKARVCGMQTRPRDF